MTSAIDVVKKRLEEKGVTFGPSKPDFIYAILPYKPQGKSNFIIFTIEQVQDKKHWVLDIPYNKRAYTLKFIDSQELTVFLDELLDVAIKGKLELYEALRTIKKDHLAFLK